MKRSFRVIVTAMLLVGVGLGGYMAGAGGLGSLTSSLAAQGECQTFPETGQQVCGRFLAYWRANGGLAQQGLPLSGEMDERSQVDGRTYKVQYFERAVFEYHPENQPPFDVLLSLLGRETFLRRYPTGLPSGEVRLQAGLALTLKDSNGSGTFQVVVAEVQEAATRPGCCGTSAQPIAAKGKFVLISLRLTNLGNTPSYLGDAFTIRDSQGRTFSVDSGSNYSPIQPSLTGQAVYIFDVAPDATGFVIVPRKS